MFSGSSAPSVGVLSAMKQVRAQRKMDNDFVAASSFDAAQYDLNYFLKGALAGGICCSITHGALTPVDVVKTRIQLDPVKYNAGLIGGFRQVVAAEGTGALLTGLGATCVGYFIQGKFSLVWMLPPPPPFPPLFPNPLRGDDTGVGVDATVLNITGESCGGRGKGGNV